MRLATSVKDVRIRFSSQKKSNTPGGPNDELVIELPLSSPKKLVHSLMTVASGPLLENVDFLNGLVTFLRLG